MSLQIWIPFVDGTLKQQGLKELTLSSSNTSIQNNGKLGKCLSFNGSSSVITSSQNVGITGDASYTIAFWMYWAGDTWSNDFVGIVGWGSMSTNKSAYAIIYNGRPDLDFWNNRYLATNQLQVKKWYHIAMVKTPGNISTTTKIYVDGQEVAATANSTITPSIVDSQLLIGRLNNSTNRWFNGYLNDVRIYDHALSQLEIKQLSQGLVLHYPLSDKYAESTTNLITTEDCLSSTCYNGATSKYNYGTTTNMYKTVTTYDGKKGTKVYAGTDGTGFWPYVYINNMYTSNGTNSPAYKTLSFDYYTTISTAIYPYKLGSGSGTATYKVSNSSGIKTGMGTDSVVIPVVPNEWNHVEITFHGTTDADAQWGYIRNNPSHTSNTSNFWFFANMQLEVKDHATGYAGVNGSRTATTFYDSSGFCNNGTISGAFTISNDTPKYIVSQNCTGTNYISLTPPSTEVKTISVWANWKTIPSGQSVIFVDYGSGIGLGLMSKGILCSTSGAGNSYTYSKSSLVANTWYHFVVVKTGTTTRKLYINGVEQTATSNTSTWTYAINELQIGKRSTTSDGFVGKISDFRAYTTELSENDIKALYEDRGYIDNKGNVYGTLYEI